MTVKLLAFAGSLRKDSYNKKLAKIIAQSAEKAGAEVTKKPSKKPIKYFDLRA